MRASCMIITTYSPLSHSKIPVRLERQYCRAVPQHCFCPLRILYKVHLRPHDLKLNQAQRHAKLGHFGHHKNCVYCQQVKSRPRQVYKNPTPVYDHIPGRSIHMDSMYLDVESRHGDWYCAPGWDDCTGYLDGIFMGTRSEAGTR